MSTKQPIHLRIWSNNKYDRESACGLFWRGRTHKWTHSFEEVTCEACKKEFHKWDRNENGSEK